MKSHRTPFALACFALLFFASCQKEVSLETGSLPPDIVVATPDTATSTPATQLVEIKLRNPSFEDSLHNWTRETTYKGRNGFKARGYAAHNGALGLSFYASQPQHFTGAREETPWNGKIYQTKKNLKDGQYRFQIYAGAVGNGMYLWADGGAGEVKQQIHSDDPSELNVIEFTVKGGVAKVGLICIDANGPQRFAPYFQADDAALFKK